MNLRLRERDRERREQRGQLCSMESRAATVHQRLLPVGFIVDCPCGSSRARRALRHPTRGTPRQEQLLLSIWRSSTRSLRQQTDIQSMHWEPISLASSSLTSCARKNGAPITRVGAAAAAAVASEPSAGYAAEKPQQMQDVVIVGGGIAGLATALALHRLGVKSVLLEQSEQLRTAGSTIGIWTNAWRALEALGVADSLREKFTKLAGLEFYAADGNCLLSLGFQDAPRDVELRGVERKALLETLREPLPDGTVLYDSQVVGIRKLDGGYTEVECENGSTMQTKVLIGCDGTGSVVARWMDFKGPRYAGYTATRGLAVFPDGHKMKNAAKQILGQGVRAGIVPMDSKRVYWFVVFNSPGERITDAELVRKEALNYVQGWPDIMTDVINKSSLETLSRRGISDRWMWPVGGPPLYRGGVTLAGDAMHPMTPNLGQGGCCALEDAVVLGRALSKVLSVRNVNGSHDDHSHEMERIELALKSYTEQRWRRMLPMAIRSYATGALLQLDYELVCAARNKLIPKILKLERFIDHTFYDCGTLS